MNSDLAVFATMKEGIVRRTPCVVSFFPGMVLITVIDAAKQKALKEEKKNQARSNGTGKMKASLSALSAVPDYVNSIIAMDKLEIEQEKTRRIPRKDIRRIAFSEATELQSVDSGSTANSSGKLAIRLQGGRLSFTHTERDPSRRIASYIKNFMK